MATVQVLKKKVEKLEQMLAPKLPDDIVMIFSWGLSEEPHGKYGYRKRHMLTGEVEPIEEKEELEMMREFYDTQVSAELKKRVWPTFEKFLKCHECKCGRHDGNYVWPKDYRFKNTNRR